MFAQYFGAVYDRRGGHAETEGDEIFATNRQKGDKTMHPFNPTLPPTPFHFLHRKLYRQLSSEV